MTLMKNSGKISHILHQVKNSGYGCEHVKNSGKISFIATILHMGSFNLKERLYNLNICHVTFYIESGN